MVRAALAVALVNDPAMSCCSTNPPLDWMRKKNRPVIDALLRRIDRGLAVLVATRSETMLAVADRMSPWTGPPSPTDLAAGGAAARR